MTYKSPKVYSTKNRKNQNINTLYYKKNEETVDDICIKIKIESKYSIVQNHTGKIFMHNTVAVSVKHEITKYIIIISKLIYNIITTNINF